VCHFVYISIFKNDTNNGSFNQSMNRQWMQEISAVENVKMSVKCAVVDQCNLSKFETNFKSDESECDAFYP